MTFFEIMFWFSCGAAFMCVAVIAVEYATDWFHEEED